MRTARYALVALVLAGCGQPIENDAPVQRQELASDGVPVNGFPNWAERTVLVLTNRMRADPQAALNCSNTECPDKPCYGPVRPVMWNYDLNRSSRFHAANLIKAGSDLQHASPCNLKTNIASMYPANCDGSQSCACASNTCSSHCNCPTGTDPFVRIGYFFPTVRNAQYGCAENIAAGYGDPGEAMDGWVNETCVNSPYICSASQCSGNSSHRYNIFNGDNVWMGSGAVAASGNYCNYGEYWWGQDFGCTLAARPAIPKLVAGSHFPQSGSEPTFYANWYSSAAPTTAQVNVDGTCHAMSRDRGAGGNATYAWTASGLSSSCHRYAFVFTDAQGTVTLPGSGAYMVGSGCADWDATAPPACGSGTNGSTSSGTTASSTGAASTSSSSSAGATSSSSSAAATTTSGGTSSSSTTGGTTSAGTTSAGSSTSGDGTSTSSAGTSGSGSEGSSASGAGAAGGTSGGTDSSVDGGCSSTGGADLLALAPLLAILGRRRERRV